MRYLIPAFAALVLATSPLAVQAQTAAPVPQQTGITPPVSAQPPATQPPTIQPAPKPDRLAQRFASANTTHDGHLTRDQARSAKWTQVVKRFTKIDASSRGYVTEQDIRTAAARARAAKSVPASKT